MSVQLGDEYWCVIIPFLSLSSDEAGADLIKDGILDRQYYDESYLGNITRVASSKLGRDSKLCVGSDALQ